MIMLLRISLVFLKDIHYKRKDKNMKVKVKKIKKNPAPVREQDERNFTWLKQKFNACYKVHIAEHSDKLKNSDKCSNKSDNIHLLANSRNKTAFSDYERNNQQKGNKSLKNNIHP